MVVPKSHITDSELIDGVNEHHTKCPIEIVLAVVGDRWSLLIIRDCINGLTRFNQIQKNLGISRNILSCRLNQLIENKILYKSQSAPKNVSSYALTEKGKALEGCLRALSHCGEHWRALELPEIPPFSAD